MAVTPEKVLRRVRGVIGTTGNESSDAAVTRLVLRAVLFDGEPTPGWRTQAACVGAPVELFYPQAGDHAARAEAKRVCAGCPVQPECLADVLGWERPAHRHGIAGGLTPGERNRLVAARRNADGGVAA